MNKENESTIVHGIECRNMACIYAAALIKNSSTDLAELSALTKNRCYKQMDEEKRDEVRYCIRILSRDMLLTAGYAPELVDGVCGL